MKVLISRDKKLVKINNIEHLLHDSDVNILYYTDNYVIIKSIYGSINILKSLNINTNYIILINKIITKYYYADKEILYLYLCAVHKYNKIVDISISDKCAEINLDTESTTYKIYVVPDPAENILYSYAFKYYNITYYDNIGETYPEYYVIIHGYKYALCPDFIKCIERLIINNSPSIYISQDKKCIFYNKNKGINVNMNVNMKVKPLCQLKLGVSSLNMLPTIYVNVNILSTIKNQDYPNIKIVKDARFILTNELLRYNFFSYFLRYPPAIFKIFIYQIDNDINIISKLKSDNVIPAIKTDKFILYNNIDEDNIDDDNIIVINEPLIFILPCQP